MVIVIKGAGDIASGIACRLVRSGFSVAMTELPAPTTVRCAVAFSAAVLQGKQTVEGITAVCANSIQDARVILARKEIAVYVGDAALLCKELGAAVLVDAVLAKINTGTQRGMAPLVIGVGPGFTAGQDCDAAVETKRGHTLGRVLYTGSPIANTGIPGDIAGYTTERLLRAGADGVFFPKASIGDMVHKGDVVAYVGDTPVVAGVSGVVRGMLVQGTPVQQGMKSGDIDPRGIQEYCFTVSDKALSVGGGVLEAILHFQASEFYGG